MNYQYAWTFENPGLISPTNFCKAQYVGSILLNQHLFHNFTLLLLCNCTDDMLIFNGPYIIAMAGSSLRVESY